ncbi:MAG: dihydrofolate reductase [Gammaproteobacteria bacterium]|nr:dihydrofolate reductase [Gammaproteobacteria bacterium]
MISLIVAMDERGGIGKGNDLLCHLPADLAFFKAQTMGKPMIMGHRTFQSIGKPLPGRRSIVLTTQAITIPGVEIAHTVAEALSFCQDVSEIMVIGGSSIYDQFLPIAQRIYLTKIHHVFEADVFFPTFDPQLWTYALMKERPADQKNSYDLTFGCYERMI